MSCLKMDFSRVKTRHNERGYLENIIEGCHQKLMDLRVTLFGWKNQYLFKDDIPAYPRPEFLVSRLKHDTNYIGLKGIRGKKGFMSPGACSLLWWSLSVGPEEIKSAEKRLLKTTYPYRTEEQVQSQWRFLKKFASSPAFQRNSRLGSYRFTFSVEEVLRAYKDQFCDKDEPVMRVLRTVLYKQEVMYVVLIHSPTNQDYSEYPLLADYQNPICSFKDGCFLWRSEAMCGTHSYELVQNDATQTLKAVKVKGRPQFYVWDNVAIALHVDDKVLKFDVNQLRQKLTFCKKAEVAINRETFQDFSAARKFVAELWPNNPSPLMRDGKTRGSIGF